LSVLALAPRLKANYAQIVIAKFRPALSTFCSVLLLWQAGVAPLAHAAVAHAAVQAVVAQEVPNAQGAADAEAMPCHGHEVDVTTSMPAPDAHAGVHGSVPTTGQLTHGSDGPDCCKSLDCQCACVHASLAAVSLPIATRVVPAHPTEMGGDLPVLRARVVELFKPPI
jgi:hypothetical protein